MTGYQELDAGSRSPAFVFASAVTGYPDAHFEPRMRLLLDEPNVETVGHQIDGDGWERLVSWLLERIDHPGRIDDLRSSYIDLFDRGQGANPLYETEYGRERAMRKTAELADLAGFYRAFGLELSDDGAHRDMLDHVSIQLEFYAVLLMKQATLEDLEDQEGIEIVRDARKKFLESHLGRFVGAIVERPGVASNPYFLTVFRWCRDLVEQECRSLEITPERVGWISGQAEPEGMGCGALNAQA